MCGCPDSGIQLSLSLPACMGRLTRWPEIGCVPFPLFVVHLVFIMIVPHVPSWPLSCPCRLIPRAQQAQEGGSNGQFGGQFGMMQPQQHSEINPNQPPRGGQAVGPCPALSFSPNNTFLFHSIYNASPRSMVVFVLLSDWGSEGE